jgi:hypothetical protein
MLARVFEERVGTSKLLATAVDCANKGFLAGVGSHVADHLVVLVEGFLFDDAILPLTGILRLIGKGVKGVWSG